MAGMATTLSSATSPTVESAAEADAQILVLTARDDLADVVLAAAAAADVPAVHDPNPDALLRPWRAVIIGVDQAASAARHGPSAAALHLVGDEADRDELCRWSATLGAVVCVLPEGVRGLSAALSGATGGRAHVIGVVGGSGGVGASTLAVALADAGARSGRRTLLIDLDACGGGLDLALGLERVPGRRWSGFAAARGFIGDVASHVPERDGLGVLAWDRDGAGEPPSTTAIASVVGSAARTHDLIVVDLARGGADLGRHIALCDGTLVVTRCELGAIAAARAVIERAEPTAPLALVARPGSLPAAEAAAALGIPLLARVPDDRAVAAAYGRGEAAGRIAGRRYRRELAALLGQVTRR